MDIIMVIDTDDTVVDWIIVPRQLTEEYTAKLRSAYNFPRGENTHEGMRITVEDNDA